MKRSTYFIVQFATLAVFYAIVPFIVPQAPPALKCAAPTPETILAQMEQEHKQLVYDQAEETASRVLHRNGCDDEYAEAIAHSAVDNAVPVRVLAALAFVESTCRANIVSHDIHGEHPQRGGSVGLLQVNSRVHKYSVDELLDPYRNAQVGGQILAGYVHRYGLKEGLHHYNGMGDETDTYSTKVLVRAGYKV